MTQNQIECPFTGISSTTDETSTFFETIYSNHVIGKIKIPGTLLTMVPNRDYKKINHIISGLSKNHFEKEKTAFEINSQLLEGGYKDHDYPKNFDQKALYLLKHFYDKGGDKYKSFEIRPGIDYALGFGEDAEEFVGMLRKLEDENFIDVSIERPDSAGNLMYLEIKLTKYGIEEIRDGLPPIPMSGLLEEAVYTGDEGIDAKIDHAKKMFFRSSSTMDDKRSACETLSFILEPIREDLKTCLVEKDVKDFFQIVNEFDIRHNKNHTKSLKYEEQLEWVFYSLLNSIICYYKLKTKLTN